MLRILYCKKKKQSTLFDTEFNVKEVLFWGLNRMIHEDISSETLLIQRELSDVHFREVSGQYMSYWEIQCGVHIVCFDRMAVSSIFNYLNLLCPF